MDALCGPPNMITKHGQHKINIALILCACMDHDSFNLQENGRTVLFYTVESGNLDLTQKLLEQGADLNNNIVDMVCEINK
jgi:ankyrin repeat protein